MLEVHTAPLLQRGVPASVVGRLPQVRVHGPGSAPLGGDRPSGLAYSPCVRAVWHHGIQVRDTIQVKVSERQRDPGMQLELTNIGCVADCNIYVTFGF